MKPPNNSPGGGRSYLRGAITGASTFLGGILHTLPFLIPQYRPAVPLALAVIAFELLALARIRRRFFGTGFLSSLVSVTLGGAIIGSGRSRHGQDDEGSGLSGRGRDDDGGPAGEAVHRRQTLAVVSRLMPASAGRRWLAEAESLLAEVTAARRGATIRSYLLSAPRLAVRVPALRCARAEPQVLAG
jgi:hypothetical protein